MASKLLHQLQYMAPTVGFLAGGHGRVEADGCPRADLEIPFALLIHRPKRL